jgi:hypothetical protein
MEECGVKESKRTPAIRFPVMEHLGPFARFLAVWNTDFPPASHQVKSLVSEIINFHSTRNMPPRLQRIFLSLSLCGTLLTERHRVFHHSSFPVFLIPFPPPPSPPLYSTYVSLQFLPRERTNQEGRRKVLTRGFDNSRLVRLGGVTVAPAAREPLHHDEKKPARPTPPHRQRLAMVEKQAYATATTEEDRLLLALHRPPNPKWLLRRAAAIATSKLPTLDPTL